MKWRSPLVRVFLVLTLLGVAGAGVVIWREHERGEKIQAEIDTLKEEADKIRRENEGLTEKILYFSSPDFQEREAKEKLGYRRLEEEVVLYPEGANQTPERSAARAAEVLPFGTPETPHYRKWWALFFQRDQNL